MSVITAIPPQSVPTPAASGAPSEAGSARRARARSIDWVGMLPYALVHLFAFGTLWTGISWQAATIFAVSYFVRMFFVTAAYHRYFAHRTFKTSRWLQAVFAFMAETSSQKGALWWAAHHRDHHKYSDLPQDLHSPVQDGFWYSHMLWVYQRGNEHYDPQRIKDFQKFPELRFLQKHWWLPPTVLGAASFALGGWSGLFFGFCASTVLLWHATFTINSLAHVWGSRRYNTSDDSRNNLWLALLTLGEGWHNNHHHYMHSTRQGFFWWEIDITYYVLKVMSWMGLVWDLREPPQWVRKGRVRNAT